MLEAKAGASQIGQLRWAVALSLAGCIAGIKSCDICLAWTATQKLDT